MSTISGISEDAFKFLNGEFLLEQRSNGGAVIAARSLWTSSIIFLMALGLRELIDPNTTFCFSSYEFRREIVEHFEWLGAIFVAVYVALYTRFSAQWAYLANLYNQIMKSRIEQSVSWPSHSELQAGALQSIEFERQKDRYAIWVAGFIADAFEMHLSTKDIFLDCILSMLNIDGVEDALTDGSPENKQKLEWLRQTAVARGRRI